MISAHFISTFRTFPEPFQNLSHRALSRKPFWLSNIRLFTVFATIILCSSTFHIYFSLNSMSSMKKLIWVRQYSRISRYNLVRQSLQNWLHLRCKSQPFPLIFIAFSKAENIWRNQPKIKNVMTYSDMQTQTLKDLRTFKVSITIITLDRNRRRACCLADCTACHPVHMSKISIIKFNFCSSLRTTSMYRSNKI